MQKCLWVVPKNIFPVRDGARVANHALLKSIRPHFGHLDILVFDEGEYEEQEKYFNSYREEFNAKNVFFLKRKSFDALIPKLLFLGLTFLRAPHLPVTTGYFNSSALLYEIDEIMKKISYDVIVFDGLHPYSAFRKRLQRNRDPKIIYRAHNVEHDLWTTAAQKTSNFIIKKLLLWQGRKMASLELELIKRAKKVWNIAEEDLKTFQKLSPDQNKFNLVPVGMEFKENALTKKTDEKKSEKIKLLFLGKMDWAPNRDGLEWFLENIWPEVDHEKLQLIIVGSGDASWGTELFKQKSIEFLGFVKDVNDAYQTCDFSIIPIRYGSGTRIKVIESISKKMPLISTAMGVQGSGISALNYFPAETKEEWLSVLKSLKKDEGIKKAQQAFNELREIYSPDIVAQKAYQTIDS